MDKNTLNQNGNDETGEEKESIPPEPSGSHEDVRSRSRHRTPTEKMREYRRELRERDFGTAHRACAGQINHIESLLAERTEISVLQEERGKLTARIDDFASAHEALYDTLTTEEERVEQNKRYDSLNHRNREVSLLLERTIRALQSQVETPNDDCRSTRSSSKKSRDSGSSKRSSAMSKSSLQKKAEMAAKVARLGTELRFLDAESQTAEKLRKHEDEIKRIKMMKELAATHAEIEAVKRIEEENFGSVKEDQSLPTDNCPEEQLERYLLSQMDSILDAESSTPTPNDGAPPVTVPQNFEWKPSVPTPSNGAANVNQDLNPRKSPFAAHVPHLSQYQPARRPSPDTGLNSSAPSSTISNHSSGEELMEKLAELLAQRQDRESLPRPEPEVFRGNPLQYPTWVKSFETFIERKTKDPSERLYYLGRYTAGEAKEAVSGLLSLGSTEAYQKAKKILTDRFGNQFMVADAFRKKINNWPKILPNDGQALRRFSDFLEHCNTAMNTIHYLRVLDDPDENQKMLKKLPYHLTTRWSRIVDEWISEEESTDQAPLSAKKRSKPAYPPFAEFCKFMKKEARISCNPVTSLNALKGDDKEDRSKSRRFPEAGTFATKVQEHEHKEKGYPKRNMCLLCKLDHELDNCPRFARLSLPERRQFVQSRALCWGCLKWGHVQKECRGRKLCRVCNSRHPTSLHDDARNVPGGRQETRLPNSQCPITNRIEVCHMKGHAESISHSLIVPVWLHHQDSPNKKVMVYALLDDQSDACFIKEGTLEKLGVDGPEIGLKLSTVLAEENITSKKITGLVVRGVKEEMDIPLPRTYTRSIIPARRSQIPRPETARKWPHLKGIADCLMPYRDDLDVGLLLGINCSSGIKPREIIPGSDNDPYAKRTALGWGVIGIVRPGDREDEDEDDFAGVNKTIAHEVQYSPRKVCHFALKTHTKEILTPLQINKMFEQDFTEARTEERSLSFEDRNFMKKMTDGVHQRKDGHYELPLPLKRDLTKLPNNKEVALNRLSKLKRRLQHDSRYQKDYLTFMTEIIERGYAERVPAEEISLNNGRVWYIPHHGVYHPKKPDKIRVVFDCSAEYAGESLNRHLLQGPDLTNNLVGVLCRFREEPVAVTCDIEGMFHQVHVNPEHRNFLRFLWWENGDIGSNPIEYRMTVHLFGATSSPGCANFALKKTASDFEDECGSEAAHFVKNDFYVDDGLKSVPTPDAAISLVKNTKKLCAKGGFNLHKFVSNHKAVIDAIPHEDRSKDIQSLDITRDTLPIERALGVQWCIASDTLQFRVELKDQPLTRRGILSTVSSVFDPLGLLAPLILVGKGILQELCRDGADWDDQVPEPLRSRWEKWRTDLPQLSNLKISRCYKPEGFGEIKSVELHHFSDASKDAYGQCSYLRLINQSDQIHCSLVMAKSRVAPLKTVTIPRLELTAALISVKTSAILQRELEYREVKEVFWTDSKVVIGYISNDARRFHVFVANRVQQIRDRTLPNQWRYVETDLNPADDASRGLNARDLIENSRWWKGPNFLWKPLDDQGSNDTVDISPDDPEVKRITTMTTQIQERANLVERLQRFSSWHIAKRAVAVCLRWRKKETQTSQEEASTQAPEQISNAHSEQSESHYVPVNIQELQAAETKIIKFVQGEEFPEEISLLRSANVRQGPQDCHSSRVMKKNSPLYKLDPFLDEDGILRVGGRLKHADLTPEAKHPAIVPKKGHVTDLIISHYHNSVEHQGRGMTLNRIRSSGLWIIRGSSAVSHHIAKCVYCQRLRGTVQEQRMADLPEDRVQPAPPFSYCAVDYFGPWYVKEGRRELKRYGVLFTCMASRAVHIEVANFLTADSFINAYRRFVARRGPVSQIRSDQGTNFVGAKNELQQALAELDQDKIRQELLKRNCDYVIYKMNVPHASHMGGVWERQIRTARNAIEAILLRHGSQLDDESLRTFMTEAEAIVNCRPLAVNDLNSPDCLDPLTPNHLLTMKSNVVLPPPGSFQRVDLYSKKRWRRVQYLVNQFWVKWKADFLQSLQTRQKWARTRRNMKEDDVVIIKDEDQSRNQWRLARVVQAYASDDGLVRKVKLLVADSSLDKHGKRSKPPAYLDRPVQKLVLLVPCDDT